MSMYVAFDLGNVIVDVDLDKFGEVYAKVGDDNYMNFIDEIHHAQDCGLVTVEQALLSKYGKLLGRPLMGKLLKAWNSVVTLNEEMFKFLMDLKYCGVRVALLSNIGTEHAKYLRGVYPKLFEGNVIHFSCDVGARKPTKLYFQSFLMENPEFGGCAFIDDRVENLEMSDKFGFNAILFNLNEFKKMSDIGKREKLDCIEEEILGLNGAVI